MAGTGFTAVQCDEVNGYAGQHPYFVLILIRINNRVLYAKSNIQITSLECSFLCISIGHNHKCDLIQSYFVSLVVLVVLFNDTLLNIITLYQLVRSYRRISAFHCPVAGVNIYEVLTQRQEYLIQQYGCKECTRLLQVVLDGLLIQRLHTFEIFQIFDFQITVAADLLSALQVLAGIVDCPCVLCAVNQISLQTIFKIICSQRLTVAPLQTVLQGDGVGQTVLTYFIGICQVFVYITLIILDKQSGPCVLHNVGID